MRRSEPEIAGGNRAGVLQEFAIRRRCVHPDRRPSLTAAASLHDAVQTVSSGCILMLSRHSASRSCSNCTKSAGKATRSSRSRVNMERKWTVRISMSQSKDEIRTRARAEVRDLLELQLAPLGRPALDALAAGPTAHILDIGCGGGTTTLEIAKSVRPTGAVCGIDVSASVLAYAKAAAEGCERVRTVKLTPKKRIHSNNITSTAPSHVSASCSSPIRWRLSATYPTPASETPGCSGPVLAC